MHLTFPASLILGSLVLRDWLGVFTPMAYALVGVICTWGLLAMVDALTERRR